MLRGSEANVPRWGNPTVWLLLVLAFGNLFTGEELRTRRPSEGGTPAVLPEHFFARLWQDPLEIAVAAQSAFAEELKQSDEQDSEAAVALLHRESAEKLRAGLEGHLAQRPEKQKVLILPVALRTGPYPEPRENRIRARYAIAAGLIDQDFVPEDPDELDVLFGAWSLGAPAARGEPETTPEVGDALAVTASLPDDAAIPYQWFRAGTGTEEPERGSDETRYSSVLVLWIDEGHLDHNPMLLHERMVTSLLLGLPVDALEHIDVSLIGPTDSDGLLALIEDAEDVAASSSGEQAGLDLLQRVGGIDVYSPWSTASLDDKIEAQWIGRGTPPGGTTGDDPAVHPDSRFVRLQLERAQLRVHRMIGYDTWLARELATELSRRVPALMPDLRPPAGTSAPSWTPLAHILRRIKFLEDGRLQENGLPRIVRVALIAEEDTLYGRAWMTLLQSAWADRVEAFVAESLGGEKRHDECTRQCACHGLRASFAEVHFEAIPYMRGIDGYVVGSEGKGAAGSPGVDNQYPAGHGQIDYLRRLQREMKQRADQDTYDVIGVLGSDVYDKLVVLEALVPLFPETLFFTTDLDARFGAPRHLGYSRNLIIASHYELHRRSADDAGAASLQTFRDSYQTAQYHAVKAAVNPAHAPREIQEEKAYLVEVGRTGFVLLEGPDQPHSSRNASQDPPSRTVAVHAAESAPAGQAGAPQREGGGLPGRGLPWASFLVLSLLFLWLSPLTVKVRSFMNNATRLHWLLLAGVIAAWVAGGSALGRWLGAAQRDEPFYLAEGVSVWPAVFVRMAGTAFCLGALVLISVELRRLRWEVREQFLGIRNPTSPFGVGSFAARLRAPRCATSVATVGVRPRRSLLQVPLALLRRFVSRDESFGDPAQVEDRPRRSPLALRILQAQWAPFRPKPRTFRQLWLRRYESADRPGPKFLRCIVFSAVFMGLMIPVFEWLGRPGSPTRGAEALVADKASVLCLAFSLLLLIFSVLDGKWFAARFLRDLIPNDVHWSRGLLAEFGGLTKDADDVELTLTKARMQVRLAAKLTERTQGFVFYPAIGICILLLGRINLFDKYAWPAALLLTFSLLLGFLVVCAWTICVAARDVKADALDDLDELSRSPGTKGEAQTKRIHALMEELIALTDGAFAPFVQHPMIRAALLPVALLGSGSILGFLSVLGAS